MAHRSLTTPIIVATAVGLTGCAAGGGSGQAVTTTVTATASSTSAATSKPSSTSSSTTRRTTTATVTATATATAFPTDPAAYADLFVRAWGIGDRARADELATSDTVATLFGNTARGGSNWSRVSSVPQDARTQVTYRNTSGDLLYVIVDTATASRGASDAIVTTNFGYEPQPYTPSVQGAGLPTSAGEYADRFVRAWGAGRSTDAEQYASSAAMTTVGGYSGPGGGDWSRSSTGTSAVTYRNSSGWSLIVYLDTDLLAAGAQDAIYSAEFRH
ncbi:hypothetical protein [Kribbia dieselivorans]|uniref:hypothetical protein n=1 Tax=Kribbia dieselivorans TaxID=331526 RepID=UPI0008381CE3|nr:hypothetical protein [Kribbia dieselivorans]